MHFLFRLLVLCALAPTCRGTQQPAGILFQSPPAAEAGALPRDPVLSAVPSATHPGKSELVGADGAGVAARSDPQTPGRFVIPLAPAAGAQFTRSGERLRLWDAGGRMLELDAPELEVQSGPGSAVLLDDALRHIEIPGGVQLFVAGLGAEDEPVLPEGGAPPETLLSRVEKLAAAGKAAESVRDGLRAALGDPETLNRPLQALLAGNQGWALLKDIDLAVKWIDTTSGAQTLGVAYDLRKAFHPGEWNVAKDGSIEGLEYAFSTEGNVAFESDQNPSDFLRSELSLDWFRSTGGVARLGAEERPSSIEDFNRLGDLLTRTKDAARSDVGREIMAAYQARCTPLYYWEIGLAGALESDQDFVEKNYVIGAQAGFNVSDGRPGSAWSRFNLVDHPAALLRLLTGYETEFTPRGNALPWILFGIDHVEPDGDDPRAAAGDTSDYWRGRVELAYRSPIAHFDGTEYYLGASWRGYWELDASNAVQRADADHPDRVVLTLASAKGLFLSYSSGRLPFDEKDSDAFELGWKLNL